MDVIRILVTDDHTLFHKGLRSLLEHLTGMEVVGEAELRLAGARTPEEANQVLKDFLPRFNGRFAIPPAQPGSAYRPAAPSLDLDGVLCFKYLRTVAKDNTVRFAGHTIQLLPGPERLSYAYAQIEIQERLDGSLVVCYRGQVIATQEAPPEPVTLRAKKGQRAGGRSPSHSLVVGVSPDYVGTPGLGAAGLGPNHEGARPQAGKIPVRKPSPDHPWRKALLT